MTRAGGSKIAPCGGGVSFCARFKPGLAPGLGPMPRSCRSGGRGLTKMIHGIWSQREWFWQAGGGPRLNLGRGIVPLTRRNFLSACSMLNSCLDVTVAVNSTFSAVEASHDVGALRVWEAADQLKPPHHLMGGLAKDASWKTSVQARHCSCCK